MQTFVFDCDVDAERGIVLHLPSSVSPGKHRLAVIVDLPDSSAMPVPDLPLAPVDERTPPRTELWRRLESLRARAAATGDLAAPMDWDRVLAEAERRRGERDD